VSAPVSYSPELREPALGIPMSRFLPRLAFPAAGGSIAPPLLLFTILFLDSRRPLPDATALAPSYFTTCAAMSTAGLTVFGGAAGAGGVASMASRLISATVGGLIIFLYATIPRRASTMLRCLQSYIEKNSRAITVVLYLVFGAFFPIRGLSGL
jgi:hypothetical protein